MKIAGQLRRSQLITTFGSGSIVALPDFSVIISATDLWKKGHLFYEPNLEQLLSVKGFKEPPVSDDDRYNTELDIPAFRFPYLHFCPECGQLMPYWDFDNKGTWCSKCSKPIVPSRFVAACINGHIEDFPYSWWVHRGDFSSCQDRDNLKIEFSDISGGLDSIVITCKSCGKKRSLTGCMSAEALKGYKCSGKRPWIDYNDIDPHPCEAQMRVLQRGASNVYFSETVSALTIPPWSSLIQSEIGKKWDYLENAIQKDPAQIEQDIPSLFGNLLKHENCTANKIKKEIFQRYHHGKQNKLTKKKIIEEEYSMFCAPDQNELQFKTEHSKVPEIMAPYFDDIVLVKRLREVQALRGFRRIIPETPLKDDKRYMGFHQENGIIPLSKGKSNWLPAIEMLGEGIFIRFRDDSLTKWEEENKFRYASLEQRLRFSNIQCENYSTRFVLIHTLAHLLIRQLSIECGFSGASIKEKLYSTYPGPSPKMSGMLLYTSSSDSDGSLGGLVRMGHPDSIERIFRNMLQEASWCSSDPVCIESTAQGFDSLNYAACHACCLLPETSCVMRNCLLDRGSVVGTLRNPKMGYLSKLLHDQE